MDELLLWDQHKSMNIGSWEGISYSIIFEYPDIDSIFASNPWLRMLEMFDGFGPIWYHWIQFMFDGIIILLTWKIGFGLFIQTRRVVIFCEVQ